jgi:hypothetical protein
MTTSTNSYQSNYSIRFFMLMALCVFTLLAAAQKTSITNGNWNTGTTWFTTGVPDANHTVEVDHAVVLDKFLTGGNGIAGSLTVNAGKSLIHSGGRSMEVKNGGSLVVNGTLRVEDLSFANGSSIIIGTSGLLIVDGDFSNNNNSNNVVIDGTLTIYGAAYNGNGGVIAGTGNVNAMGGGFTGPGTFSGSITLPVELLEFSAEERNSLVQINWATASELNNDYFTLEKSTDGINFSSAGVVRGAGTSSTQKEYSLYDEAGKAMVYYRLKQTDFNGSSSYCGGTISCRPRSQAGVAALPSVFPNPVVNSDVYIRLSEERPEDASEVILTNLHGEEVYRFKSGAGAATLTIPQVVLTHGTYMLTIKTGNTVVSKKLVVK